MKSPLPPLPEPDPDAPPSAEELREAEELRDALADASREHEEATLARALVLAHRPPDLARETHAALIEQALAHSHAGAGAGAGAAEVQSLALYRSRRARQAWVVTGASVLALAASALFFQKAEAPMVASLDRQALPAHVRSSQSLFPEPFSVQGGTSDRIDRIARSRARDLRENRFAQWDVR